MNFAFERFVARRYLTAKRKHAVISVITGISILGVAAGVMALIIALAITNGFRNTLQRTLLGATAHAALLEKEPGIGFEEWPAMAQNLRTIPHVTSVSPVLYGQVLYSGPLQGQGGVLKGIAPGSGGEWGEIAKYLKQGSLERLEQDTGYPGVLLGARLASRSGMLLDSIVTVISPNGDLTPLGPRPSYHKFRVVGIFESGFFDLDNTWGFARLKDVQMVMGQPDVVNAIELKLDDVSLAPEIARQAEQMGGNKVGGTHWQEQNRQILSALKMDRVVTVITISLIQLIAALNILISLIMMVMEKNRDIAVLVSMGARWDQIRRIFILQGLMIGAVGSAIGLVLGYGLSYLAEHYRWISLDAEVYALSYVPFEPRAMDAIWVTGGALLVSFLATLYPARQATKVLPAEALRYE
jgi:lipoprotein-releasing system permease protein